MVLLSAQGMDAAAIAKVAFTSEDRIRDVIRNFNAEARLSTRLRLARKLYCRNRVGFPRRRLRGRAEHGSRLGAPAPGARTYRQGDGRKGC
jgi:hypothetical protein